MSQARHFTSTFLISGSLKTNQLTRHCLWQDAVLPTINSRGLSLWINYHKSWRNSRVHTWKGGAITTPHIKWLVAVEMTRTTGSVYTVWGHPNYCLSPLKNVATEGKFMLAYTECASSQGLLHILIIGSSTDAWRHVLHNPSLHSWVVCVIHMLLVMQTHVWGWLVLELAGEGWDMQHWGVQGLLSKRGESGWRKGERYKVSRWKSMHFVNSTWMDMESIDKKTAKSISSTQYWMGKSHATCIRAVQGLGSQLASTEASCELTSLCVRRCGGHHVRRWGQWELWSSSC